MWPARNPLLDADTASVLGVHYKIPQGLIPTQNNLYLTVKK
jgi:hypothetical protein